MNPDKLLYRALYHILIRLTTLQVHPVDEKKIVKELKKKAGITKEDLGE